MGPPYGVGLCSGAVISPKQAEAQLKRAFAELGDAESAASQKAYMKSELSFHRDLFVRIAAPMLEDKEFFIRKAIGWVLRDISKRRPDEVHAFLLQHRERASGLTLREGAKHLPASMRQSLGLPPAARAA